MGAEMHLVDWTAERYHADRTAVAKSWLDHIHRSPAHLRAFLDGLIPPTPRMKFGTLVHARVLEPDSIDSRYLRVPNRDTKAGEAKYEQLSAEAAARGLTVVDDESWRKATAIKDSVYAHRTAAILLGKGKPEQSVFWTNADTGEQCKARADFLREQRPDSTSVLSVQEVVPIRIFLRVWGMLCVPVILGNIGHASAQTMGLHSVHIESHSHLPYWFKPYPCSLKNISDPSRWPITLAIPGHVLHTPLTERRNPTGRGHAHAYHRLYPL
jgi:PDDEXK-like domain of unknown function (DUF3799)